MASTGDTRDDEATRRAKEEARANFVQILKSYELYGYKIYEEENVRRCMAVAERYTGEVADGKHCVVR